MQAWSSRLATLERMGEIEQFTGLKIVANGPPQAFIGELCDILDGDKQVVMQAEVIGFAAGKVYLMPFSQAPVRMGYQVRARGQRFTIGVSDALLGQIVDAFARPLDEAITLQGLHPMPLHNPGINPLLRQPIREKLHTGIHAIDSLLPLGKGQRMGLFAGSGVGKSVLLGMMAKHLQSDVNVIALIGERGREVNDFIHNHLDETARSKSVIIAACSDDTALLRRQAVYTATTIAEYFCRQGKDVMLMMDSITRFAMAQREISLSLGEPPTARGYTPSVFSLLPAVVERAGNFINQGSITALYTVLVEGDDFNEPIADALRSLLDGHIILTRELAHKGHYPAIDVLQSISRLARQLQTPAESDLASRIIGLLSLYHQHRDLIELGAYKAGQNPKLDEAVKRIEPLQQLLTQNMNDSQSHAAMQQALEDLMK